MTIYAHDPEQDQVLAVWPKGTGSTAIKVTTVGTEHDIAMIALLCEELTDLSAALWHTYIQPASAAEDDQERSSREAERAAFTEVGEGIRMPNLPSETGVMRVSYVQVREAAHRTGRVLHRIHDPRFTEAVVTDVEREIGAVEQAELGDLTGRAAQATVMDRLDTSPIQVMAADELFQKQPLGDPDLFTTLDPASSCVAGAHWLTAAACVTAELANISPAAVFAESDNINACSIEVPQLVVGAIDEHDHTPRAVVMHLLTEAADVSEGRIPDLGHIIAQIADAEERATEFSEDRRQEAYEAFLPNRVTLLDPRRPARDLLEHLLDGIGAAHTLFHNCVDYGDNGEPVIDDEPLPHPGGEGWTDPGDDPDDDHTNAVTEAVDTAFIERVRVEADLARERLS